MLSWVVDTLTDMFTKKVPKKKDNGCGRTVYCSKCEYWPQNHITPYKHIDYSGYGMCEKRVEEQYIAEATPWYPRRTSTRRTLVHPFNDNATNNCEYYEELGSGKTK